MKARIGEISIEGTPEEISSLIRSLELGPFGNLSFKKDFLKPESTEPSPDNGRFVDEDLAFRALKRRPLSTEQKTVLSTLAANHPKWTVASELRVATGYSRSQLAGLLGAFGKRIRATKGYIEGSYFFDQEWDYEADCYKYILPQTSLNAVKRVGL